MWTMLSKIEKIQRYCHLVVILEELHSAFIHKFFFLNVFLFQLQVKECSTLQKILWFEQKLGLKCQKMCILFVFWILECF